MVRAARRPSRGAACSSGNGTDDQCEKSRTHYHGSDGSQCSLKSRCTIPYRDRETKPVAWWVNTDMPPELQDSFDGKGQKIATGPTEDITYTWNQAIGLAIAHAREVECRRTLRPGGYPQLLGFRLQD